MKRRIAAIALTVGGLIAVQGPGIAQMTREGSREAEGRRICRYTDVTGKMAARRRVCLTKAEWDRAAEEQRRVSQSWIQNINSCKDGITCVPQ